MKKIVAVVLTGSVFTATCFADSIDIVEQNKINGMVTVSGTYDKTEIFRPKFVLKITDAGNNIVAFTQNDNNSEDNKFIFEVPVDGISGEYTVTVNSNAFENELVKTFNFVSDEDIKNALDEINGSKTSDELKTAIEKNAEILSLSIELIEGVTDKAAVFATVFKGVQFEDIFSLSNEIIKAAVTEHIFENKQGSVDLLEEYQEALNLNAQKTYPLFEEFSKDDKRTLISKISSLKDEGEFYEIFDESVILTKIKNADSYGVVGEVLKEYKDIVYESDISEYFTMKNTSSVDIKLVGNDYSDISELQKDIGNNLTSLSKPSGGGSGGGGGAGGGNSLATVVNPVTENIQKPENAENIYFNDIGNVEWANEAINSLASRGILNGKGEGTFKPNELVTREEIVKILVEAFGIETTDENEHIFDDVLPGAWYEKYVAAGVKIGAVNGIGGGKFGVSDLVTRQDMAVLAYKFAKVKGYEFKNSGDSDAFLDRAIISDYAKEPVSYLLGAEILNGMGDGNFAPKSGSTRAQAAVLVYRLLRYTEGGQI